MKYSQYLFYLSLITYFCFFSAPPLEAEMIFEDPNDSKYDELVIPDDVEISEEDLNNLVEALEESQHLIYKDSDDSTITTTGTGHSGEALAPTPIGNSYNNDFTTFLKHREKDNSNNKLLIAIIIITLSIVITILIILLIKSKNRHGDNKKISVKIIYLNGHIESKYINMQIGARIKLGRSSSSEICISDAKVSRYHACIRLSERGLSIKNESTTNSIKYKGKRLPSDGFRRIHLGHSYTIGSTQVIFNINK